MQAKFEALGGMVYAAIFGLPLVALAAGLTGTDVRLILAVVVMAWLTGSWARRRR